MRLHGARPVRWRERALLHRGQASLALLQGDRLQQMRLVTQRPPLFFLRPRLVRVPSAAWLVAVLTAATAGCGSCGGAAPTTDAGTVAAVEPPVPAPDGLLAEGWVRGPDAVWAKLQSGVSGAVALLPPTTGELACAVAGLDSHVAPLVDGKGTSFIVLADGAGGGVAWALALPLTDPAAAAKILLGASDAQGASRDVAGMHLAPGTGRPTNVMAALGSRWLVLAGDEDDLKRLGPYAVRTMPTKAVPSDSAAIVVDVPALALAGPLSQRIAAKWDETRAWLSAQDEDQRAKHGGRAPDFGDPRVIVDALDGAAKHRIALVTAARGAHLTIDAGDDEVHAEVLLTPGTDPSSAKLLAAMHPSTSHPLAEVPADAVVALLARDDAATRAEDSATLEATIEHALGDRIHDEDSRAVRAAIDDWARARGDWLCAALAEGATDATRGVWLRTPAAGEEAATNAVREIVDLSRRQAFRQLLAGSLHLGPSAVATAEVPILGKANVATFAVLGPNGKSGAAAAGLGVAWGVHDGELLVAGGSSPASLLAGEVSAPTRVGDTPRSARAIAALGNDATIALFAQPLRLDPRRAGDAASGPAVVAWGKKGESAWARLELADVLLREWLRLKAGL
jgi:hypothetical protein